MHSWHVAEQTTVHLDGRMPPLWSTQSAPLPKHSKNPNLRCRRHSACLNLRLVSRAWLGSGAQSSDAVQLPGTTRPTPAESSTDQQSPDASHACRDAAGPPVAPLQGVLGRTKPDFCHSPDTFAATAPHSVKMQAQGQRFCSVCILSTGHMAERECANNCGRRKQCSCSRIRSFAASGCVMKPAR